MLSVYLSIQEQRVSKRGREGLTSDGAEDSSFDEIVTISRQSLEFFTSLRKQLTRTCYHLPRDYRYVVSILKSDQSLFSMLEFDIKDGAILDLKPFFPHQ